jgi:hypothetical protein
LSGLPVVNKNDESTLNKTDIKQNKPISNVTFAIHDKQEPSNFFEKYENERLQRSYLKDQVEGPKYEILKTEAVGKI